MAHRIQLRARREQLFTYSGRTVLITDLAGRLPEKDPHGLFVDNARYLSRFELRIGGKPLSSVSASTVGADGLLSFDEVPSMD
ncbi:MAG TPA: glycogen debranching N-terminal domain-containing protein, partial [Candidatus Limnocylindria bacterium]|nr:glycogen debranching N-terminal domain-containing protein [Candidatus Limnocylindria bacterium]